MAVTSIAGSAFTVTIASTAYTSQITSGSIAMQHNFSQVDTLDDTAYTVSRVKHEVTLEFLYDTETGMFGALYTAANAGTAVSVTIVGGDAKWTGTSMYVSALEGGFETTGPATASCTLIGAMTFADAP
jgi:uncharacterized protein YbbC (DUF1343 family)